MAVWIRPPGDADASAAAASGRVTVDLDKWLSSEVTRFDAQYGKSFAFRGVPLAAIMDRTPAPLSADLALLHFANGMVVPFPFRDKAAVARLDPLVARSARASTGDQARMGEFPPLTQKLREYVDVPSTTFAGNKLVVAERWHPALRDKSQATFSPWAEVDTLVGIEYVESSRYYRQFDVDPAASAGFALFNQTCQFCHGARKVGAKFGWDFVEPTPMYKYRKNEKRLYNHIHYRRFDAVERGLLMPALKSMTEADARLLWQWLKAIGTNPMPPYTPSSSR